MVRSRDDDREKEDEKPVSRKEAEDEKPVAKREPEHVTRKEPEKEDSVSKDWVRRELELMTSGVSLEERKKLNR